MFERDGEIVVFENGEPYAFRDPAVEAGPGAEGSSGLVASPMPGRVVAVAVAIGDSVAKGASLVVVGAMKMELTLQAPFAGTVAEVPARVGQQVAEGATLVRLQPEGEADGR